MSAGQSLFGMNAEAFNALGEKERADKIEAAEQEKFYFGVVMEYKLSMNDVRLTAYDLERLPQ